MSEVKSFDKGMKISFKDLVWIVTLVASMIGMYYTLTGRTDVLEREVKDLEQELHETNIKLLEHDINYLKKEEKIDYHR